MDDQTKTLPRLDLTSLGMKVGSSMLLESQTASFHSLQQPFGYSADADEAVWLATDEDHRRICLLRTIRGIRIAIVSMSTISEDK